MNVQVVYLLLPIGTSIAQQPKPTLRVGSASFLQGQPWRQDHHTTEQALMFGLQLRHRRNVQLGDQQKVHRRPGVDVVKGIDVIVLIHQP
jgi:hypothetical protein